ncbi:unnamed protein product [Allacma fusca]|uniref:FIP-RBD domain-containing protein n=1 Tax=Allacma fusca TaxID=39272 RepID=A0A8J2J9S8_9HEXA|nr:unnamed protein product [Allacma fusca]
MDQDVQRLNVSRRLSFGSGSATEQQHGPTVVTNLNHNSPYEIINHLKISNNNNNVHNHKFSTSSPSPPPLPTSSPPSQQKSTPQLSDALKLTARSEPESSLSQVNDSSSSTLKTSGLSSPPSLDISSSSSLKSPPSTSTPKSRRDSARVHETPPSDISSPSGDSSAGSTKFKSNPDNRRRGVKNGTVPHLTISPETPPIHSSPSSHEFPASTSRSTAVFADLGKMKSMPGASSRKSALSNHSYGLADMDMNVSSSSAAGLSHNGHAGNMNSILSENSNVNHSHSSSNISSTEENFECLGEGPESFLDSHSEHNSLQFSRDVNDLSSLSVPGDGPVAPPIRRNSWLRTSLRKSPQQQPGSSPNGDTMGHRRWGSFRNSSGSKRPAVTSSSALANQLYRSSSFHSSGRSSAGDGEEMYSDGSLEDEVIDLTQKVHHLEEKFSVLAENQTDVDDRYVRIKQENTELSTKLFMAEESLRDVEQRADEKLRDEQKRFKDVLARAEREKQLHIENYDIRLRSCEKDMEQAKSEVARLKQKLDRERTEKTLTGDKLLETERELANLREDHRALVEALRKERDAYLLESKASQQALVDLRKEVETMRKQRNDISSSDILPGHTRRFNSVESESETAELKSRLIELEEEKKSLKQQNTQLQEANDELNAQILNHGLEEGRHLLTVNRNIGDLGNSLAAEFEAMSQDQLKKALKEQTEVNDQLRTYIDGILLNIVENYPQLLEVKNKSSPENSLD